MLSMLAAPSVLRAGGGHSERVQPDLRVHGRQDVLLVPRHALSATGRHRASSECKCSKKFS